MESISVNLKSYSTTPKHGIVTDQLISDRDKLLCALYFLVISAAELVVVVNDISGLLFHVGILCVLIFHSSFSGNLNFQFLLLSLCVCPLIRILSLSMPLYSFGYMMWILVIAVPVFIAIIACMWYQRLDLKDVGLRLPESKHIPLEVGITLGGIPLGLVEYQMLKPMPVVSDPDSLSLIALVLLLTMYTGFIEELAFRGLMQHNAVKTIGPFGGILFISVIFGVLHLGNLPSFDAGFAAAVGIVYALTVRKTGSLFGVTLSHGLNNSMLFVFAPLYLS